MIIFRFLKNYRPMKRAAILFCLWIPCFFIIYTNWKILQVSVLYSKNLMQGLDCKRIIQGDKSALQQGMEWKPRQNWSDGEIFKLFDTCTDLRDEFALHGTYYVTAEELQFPLAFAMIVHSNLEQVLRLLKAIYWQHNIYCITYDMKSSVVVKKFVQKIARCFPNIILPEKHETIYWATFSVLKAAINCAGVLQNHTNRWRYMQILSGNDFPLKTNREMVQILKTLNGTSDTEFAPADPSRWANKSITSLIPGKNVTIFKGSFAATLSREFVKSIFENELPQQLLEFLKDTDYPDEQFWATLMFNPQFGVPKSVPARCMKNFPDEVSTGEKPWISRFHIWPDSRNLECHGEYRRGSCVLGLGDIFDLLVSKRLVAHKFYLDVQPAVLFCLNEIHERKIKSRKNIDLSYYENLPQLRYWKLPESKRKNCDFDGP